MIEQTGNIVKTICATEDIRPVISRFAVVVNIERAESGTDIAEVSHGAVGPFGNAHSLSHTHSHATHDSLSIVIRRAILLVGPRLVPTDFYQRLNLVAGSIAATLSRTRCLIPTGMAATTLAGIVNNLGGIPVHHAADILWQWLVCGESSLTVIAQQRLRLVVGGNKRPSATGELHHMVSLQPVIVDRLHRLHLCVEITDAASQQRLGCSGGTLLADLCCMNIHGQQCSGKEK